jgi:hypothetical protein
MCTQLAIQKRRLMATSGPSTEPPAKRVKQPYKHLPAPPAAGTGTAASTATIAAR